MINPDEIMLGNWVKYSRGKGKVQIDIINIEHVCMMYHLFSPIPLTAELMPKIGFMYEYGEPPHYINYKTKNGFCISEATVNYPYGFCDRAGSFYYGGNHIEIKSVHMLQNLHFIITGKHLQFKL